jgi:predicted TIM-barrel fold metal-dependent hydrolase
MRKSAPCWNRLAIDSSWERFPPVRRLSIEKHRTEYATPYRTSRDVVAHLSDGEQAAVLHDTASRLYRI